MTERVQEDDLRVGTKLMNHIEQRDVFEGARHRHVVVESVEGPFEDLDRRRTLETLVHRLQFIEEVNGW